jgi:ribonuclease HI
VIEAYIDGGCRGNPGNGAVGYVVLKDGNELCRFGKKIGRCTNNVAEYSALIDALEYLKSKADEVSPADSGSPAAGNEGPVTVYSDSELLIMQMTGRYRVKSGKLKPLYEKAQRLLKEMKYIRLVHIGREKNKTADLIVNRVLDDRDYKTDL